MKRLLPVLMGFALLLLSSTEGWSFEPDKFQFCSGGKLNKQSHLAVFGKCSNAFETGNYESAFREWKFLAEKGNVHAQINLGLMYLDGKFVPKNPKIGIKWLKLAAGKGEPFAHFLLGFSHINKKDYKTGIKLIRISANQGLALGQAALAGLYLKGRGVLKDSVQAYKWMILANKNGGATSLGDFNASEILDQIANKLTPSQLEEGQRLARKFIPKNSAPLVTAKKPCPGSYNPNKTHTWNNCVGTRTFTNGDTYVGQWKKGKWHGEGTLTYADGEKYVGGFRNGLHHGNGTITHANGKTLKGIWENDKFKSARD